jgi:hypothetical protein
MLAFAFFIPIVGLLLAGALGTIAVVLAIRAMVITGDRSPRGRTFAIIALVIASIPALMGGLFLAQLLLTILLH